MIVFFISIVFLIGLTQFKGNFISFADCQKIVVVSSEVYEKLDQDPIKNGGDYYHVLIGTKREEFESNIRQYNYKGLVLYYDQSFLLDYFKKTYSFNFTNPSRIDDYQIYYGYTSSYRDFRIVDGKKINVQLVKNNEGWIVGMPMILTGF